MTKNSWFVVIIHIEFIPQAIGGGVVHAKRQSVVLGGLGQPHSLSVDGDGFIVLDSDAHRVVRFDHYGI